MSVIFNRISGLCVIVFFFFKQKTAYEMRISDWSSDVCSSDLLGIAPRHAPLITRLKPGKVVVTTPDGQQLDFAISGGILEVQPQVEIGRASCRERVCQYV